MCLFDSQMLEGSKPTGSHGWSQRHPLFLVSLSFTSHGDMLGDMEREVWKGAIDAQCHCRASTRQGPTLVLLLMNRSSTS